MPVHYVTVLDAGSTGTRIIVYKWDTDIGDGVNTPLVIQKVFPVNGQACPQPLEGRDCQRKPGIHEFKKRGARDMGEYLNPLLHAARDFLVGEGVVGERPVPIYLFATAGMRGIRQAERGDILAQAWWRMSLVPPFNAGVLSDSPNGLFLNVRVISGKAEALFAWIANNYGRAVGARTTGIVEIGGDSAQIAFAPSPHSPQGDRTTICLFSRPTGHQVYAKSWYGLGTNRAQEALETDIKNDDNVPTTGTRKDNPCIPKFYKEDVTNFTGTGDFGACKAKLTRVLREKLRSIPAYPKTINFVGLGTPYLSYKYFSTLEDKPKNPSFDITLPYNQAAYAGAVTRYCNGLEAPAGDELDDYRFRNCFAGVWTLTVLRESFQNRNRHAGGILRFPADGDLASRSSWTLGVVALLARHQGLLPCPNAQPLPIDELNNNTRFGEVDWPPIFLPSDSVHDALLDIATAPPTEPANIGITHPNCLTVMSSPTDNYLAVILVILIALVAFTYRRRRISASTGKISLPTDMKETGCVI